MKNILVPIVTFMCFSSFAQYAPAAGQIGTDALHKDTSVFINWATACTLQRGPMDVSNPNAGLASAGNETSAMGRPQQNGTVSLGDGGIAVITFDRPIRNGVGPDFAVFENGFTVSGDSSYFLELAFVEVSSDGIHFFRFPSVSLTDTVLQTGTFGGTDPRRIYNLAGKYTSGYGTPFDLDDLSQIAGLETESITHVRIIDVTGSINPIYATRDAGGRKINDPWPTAFASSGFDLDAIGVIHEASSVGITESYPNSQLTIFPNPAQSGFYLKNMPFEKGVIRIATAEGIVVYSKMVVKSEYISIQGIVPGLYVVTVEDDNIFSAAKLNICP